MPSPLPLAGQVAIVTGGAKGIGRTISLALVAQGASLMVTGRELAPLEEVAQEAVRLGREALAHSCDVAQPAQVEEMVRRTLERFGGRIDILVNVAGIAGPVETPVQDIDPAAFEEVMRVNVTGTFLPIRYSVPAMIAQRSGRIVNIGSNSGTAGYIRRTGYCASKWAVRGITRTVALELGPYGITVNCINPGIVAGPRMERLCRERAAAQGVNEADIRAKYVAAQAIPRVTTAGDVAAAVVFLAGESGRNITGQDIDVDGGWQI